MCGPKGDGGGVRGKENINNFSATTQARAYGWWAEEVISYASSAANYSKTSLNPTMNPNSSRGHRDLLLASAATAVCCRQRRQLEIGPISRSRRWCHRRPSSLRCSFIS